MDMSLDDMIKMNKKKKPDGGGPLNPNSSRGGSRPRNSGPGPSRRFPNRTANRTSPFSHGTDQGPETKWQHDMFADHAAAYPALANRVSAIETGTKLLISNLDYGVSDEDIKELFSEVGDLKRYSVDYDKSGRSKGTAEVVFSRRKDAEAAVKRYNNIQLDGKPMKIETVGAISAVYDVITPSTKGSRGYGNGARRRNEGRGGVMARLQGGNRPTRGRERGRGHGDKESEKVSAEDLDTDLEKYHAEAMQTN